MHTFTKKNKKKNNKTWLISPWKSLLCPYISMEISYKIKNLLKIENSLRWSTLISNDKLSSINIALHYI